jgi:hypothetical protein
MIAEVARRRQCHPSGKQRDKCHPAKANVERIEAGVGGLETIFAEDDHAEKNPKKTRPVTNSEQ